VMPRILIEFAPSNISVTPRRKSSLPALVGPKFASRSKTAGAICALTSTRP